MLADLSLPDLSNRLGSLTVTTKEHQFAKNDFVRIINDENRVKRFQRGHGEWAEVMTASLGRIGKVRVSIFLDQKIELAQIW